MSAPTPPPSAPISVTGRYVKLNISAPTQTTDVAARIYELRVFGPQAVGTGRTAGELPVNRLAGTK